MQKKGKVAVSEGGLLLLLANRVGQRAWEAVSGGLEKGTLEYLGVVTSQPLSTGSQPPPWARPGPAPAPLLLLHILIR